MVLSVNNPTPFNHGGSSVLSINNGGNETWVDTGGAIHQTNTGVQSNFGGSITVGPNVYQPDLTYTGYLLQVNGPNTAYQPLTLGGGHAGSLNVITTPTIAAPYHNVSATPGDEHYQLRLRGHGLRRQLDQWDDGHDYKWRGFLGVSRGL